MCIGLARDSVGGGGEWIRGFGFTNPAGKARVLDVCLHYGGVGGELVEGWCYVCVSTDSLCRWKVQVSVYCAM